MIFHLAARDQWDTAGDTYAPPAFADEGFVHCSYGRQVAATAARYYAGRTDLVLLAIAEDQLTAPLVVEPSPASGEPYPHVYGPIDRAAVVTVHDLALDDAGQFVFPPAVTGA